jgi:outer membrane protein OmpA-like peptidoglycan-associated protein
MESSNKTVLATLVAATFAAGSAQAAHPGFYIGAGGGESTVKASTDPLPDGELGFNTFHFDQSETAFKGFVGYQFLPWLGIEGGYVDFGSPSDDQDVIGFGTIDGDVDATAWEGFVVGTLPIGPVDLFVKGGGANAKVELKVHDNFSGLSEKVDDNNAMWAYGGGAALNLGHFSIRAEYEEYDTDHFDDLYVVTGSLIYRFYHDKPKPVPVAAPMPAPAPAPKPAPVAAKCPDGDRDGVCDAADQCPDTPAGTRVGPGGCDCDYSLDLQFALNSAELTAQDKAKIDQIIPVLKNPKVGFIAGEIDGYTDSTGTDAYNLDLSQRRAESVATYAKAQGVALGDRFVTHGYGEAHPIASNDTKEGRAQNRRVVLRRTDCGPAHP